MDQNNPPSFANTAPVEAKLHFLDYWRVIRIRKAIIITVFLITAFIATAVTFMLPESYSSTCDIEVAPDGGVTGGINSTIAAQSFSYDPFFIQNTFQIMQSQVVLSNVISSLHLNETWAKKYMGNGDTLKTTETIELLKGRMVLAPVKNTKLISITVYSENKDEAATIANQIAKSYQEYRLNNYLRNSTKGLESFKEQFALEANDIQTLRSNADILRRDLGINDDQTSLMPNPTLEKQELERINGNALEKEVEYVKLLEQLNSLKSIRTNNPEQLRDVLPTMVNDSELQTMLSTLHEDYVERSKLLVDYAMDTPVVQRTQKQIDTLEQQVNDKVNSALISLQTQVNATKAALDTLREKVEIAKKTDFDNAIKFQPYYNLKRDLLNKEDSHKLLNAKIMAMETDIKIPASTMAQIVNYAQPGINPVRPNKPVNIILGLVFGLIMGVGLAFFIEYLDTSVKTIDDVERTFQAPVLGVIPQNIGYLLEEGVESNHAEAYRVLRTNLLFSRKDEKFNTIVMVSAGAGEGKSTTTINLATVFAQAGNRVLIVDSDLRRPTLHKLFKVANNLGLTNYLLKQNTLVEIVQTTQVPNLDFMASGKLPNSAMGILGSAQMKEMINELKQRYDFIFFDSPPILGVSDASILASEVDLVMQVIQYRRYPQPMTIRAKQMIEKVGGNFVGLVLNNINMSQDEGYYYYSGYYHDYYYSRTPEEQEAEEAATASESGDTEITFKSKKK